MFIERSKNHFHVPCGPHFTTIIYGCIRKFRITNLKWNALFGNWLNEIWNMEEREHHQIIMHHSWHRKFVNNNFDVLKPHTFISHYIQNDYYRFSHWFPIHMKRVYLWTRRHHSTKCKEKAQVRKWRSTKQLCLCVCVFVGNSFAHTQFLFSHSQAVSFQSLRAYCFSILMDITMWSQTLYQLRITCDSVICIQTSAKMWMP